MGVDTVAGVVKGLLSLCKSKTKSVGNLIWVPDRSEIARCLWPDPVALSADPTISTGRSSRSRTQWRIPDGRV